MSSCTRPGHAAPSDDSQVIEQPPRYADAILDGRIFPKPTQNVGLCADGSFDQPPLPSEPTSASPGSPEKIEVMRRRAERGEHLYHPGDEQTVARIANTLGRPSRFD